LVGLGKITVDQHIPSIRASSAFSLVGGVSPRSRVEGLPTFASVSELLASGAADAVAVNTPPQARFSIAREALLAGKHVLLEKPPCGTVAELNELERMANGSGSTLYTGWHSQHAPAVQPAKAWLRDKTIRRVAMRWCENVRQWHPGQTWIWQPGGLGVFDPGINALSILTAILPEALTIERATLEVPANCQTPIAAELNGRTGSAGVFEATLDFLQTGKQTWNIEIETEQGELVIAMGGAELVIDGVAQMIGESREYPSIYSRFAKLVADGSSEVDARPLALTADAFLVGERVTVEEFIE
jgi:predicted dehydrogenase